MYFIFNDIDSRDLGLRVKDIQYDVLAKRRINLVDLPTYDGVLLEDEETFESYSLDIECYLVDNFSLENIKRIKNLFKVGYGKMIFSHKPNNIYEVVINNTINFSEMLERTGACIISLTVQPISYLKNGSNFISVGRGTKLNNLGNYYSKPIFKVDNPSSVVEITVNGSKMKFTNVNKAFIVDCELEDVYGEKGENLNSFMTIESDFQVFNEGENLIEYVGVNEIKVKPNWREV